MSATMKSVCVALITSVVLLMPAMTRAADEGYLTPLAPWHVVVDDDIVGSPLEAISYEWEYYMIHDRQGRFNGIVGYLIANPRQLFTDIFQLVPNGGNMAIVGELRGAEPTAEFITFGPDNTTWNEEDITWDAFDPVTGYFGTLTPIEEYGDDAVPALRLEGSSAVYEWDLIVTQGWPHMNPMRLGDDGFTVVPGTDVGILHNEIWTLDAVWPATRVEGTVTVRETGEVLEIIGGKGYRENSYGMYLLSIDGWDFMVFNDHDETILGVWQTYHKSDDLDYLDLGFYDNGELITERFRKTRGELGWRHDYWKWDREARQCVPTVTRVQVENDRYSGEFFVEIGDRQEPLLSSATLGTEIFFIQEQFPTVSGTIWNADGDVIKEFEVQAGGEFAFHKNPAWWHSNWYCTLRNKYRFWHPFP